MMQVRRSARCRVEREERLATQPVATAAHICCVSERGQALGRRECRAAIIRGGFALAGSAQPSRPTDRRIRQSSCVWATAAISRYVQGP